MPVNVNRACHPVLVCTGIEAGRIVLKSKILPREIHEFRIIGDVALSGRVEVKIGFVREAVSQET